MRRPADDCGITLIELVVVVVVVGVLAAIAVPTFLQQRESAYRAEAVHDVRKTMTAIEAWRAGGATDRSYDDLDAMDAEALEAVGIEVSVGQWTELRVVAADDTGYCLEAVHEQYAGNVLVYDKADGTIRVATTGALGC